MTELVDRYRAMATEDLASAWRDLGGLMRAVQAQRLAMLAVLDEREAYRLDGCLDTAQWVAATDMVHSSTARKTVAVAKALPALPAIAAVVEAGGLSFEQLAPLVVIARPDSDARWANDAPGMTPAMLDAQARERRRVEREEAERQRRRRSFRWWKDRNGLGTRFAGLLPDDAAAIVTGRIESIAKDAKPDEQGDYEPYESRCADALLELASASCAEAGVTEVVVHVPVGVDKLAPTLNDGTPLSIEVIRRLACDATVRLLVENPDGTVAGYGRRRRIVPDKMRLRLRQRDRHCAWPGCDRTRAVKAHHLTHWTAEGETEEDNCVLLCPRHHSLAHEGGWTITGNATERTLRFERPACGTAIPTAPTAAPTDLLTHFGLDAA